MSAEDIWALLLVFIGIPLVVAVIVAVIVTWSDATLDAEFQSPRQVPPTNSPRFRLYDWLYRRGLKHQDRKVNDEFERLKRIKWYREHLKEGNK